MYKLSYYTLFSDLLNSKQDSVLYCTRTGEAFVVSKELRQNLSAGHFNLVSKDILDKLIIAKGVVYIDEDELAEIQTQNKEAVLVNSNAELYVVIQPSANCQLGCYYCGQAHSKDNILPEYSQLLIERVKGKLKEGTYNSIFVGWFGGEPLMALQQIRELTQKFIDLATEFGVKYSAKVVTNGLSLKSKIYNELVTALKVSQIEVTLDGTADYHDAHRYTKEGGKSFDLIYRNLKDIFNGEDYEKLNCRISIRCNVDKRNWEDVSNLISLLSKDNLHTKVSSFYPIGIYSWGGNDAHNHSLTKEDFAKKEIDWLIEMIQAGFNPSILPGRRKQVCAAVSPDFEMYDTFGNVFNCTEVSFAEGYQHSEYALGNIKNPEAISSKRPLNDWNDTLLTDKFPCHTCKMLPVCGGGCPKSWHEDMRACPSAKFNIKERLALAYVLSKADLKELS